LCFFFVCILFNFICSGATLLPGFWQTIVELFYEFFYFSIFTENVKKESSYYFPVFFTTFAFIFFCNILGMVPYSFAVTSHIAVTLALATLAFLFINFVGVRKHGFRMLSLFLPPGAPLILAPLLIMIELVSYSFRVVSLALRLFANMMSGHCLLKILAGFAWAMFASAGIFSFAHFLPLLVIFAIVGLELAIAFLQAYVFVILLCIYLNDALNLH
jgi:ATP synthase subunit 6